MRSLRVLLAKVQQKVDSANFALTEFSEVRRRRGVFSDLAQLWRPPDQDAPQPSSAFEARREVEPTEALRFGQYVDLGDLSACDCEAHDRERRTARGPRDDPRDPVH